MGVISILTRIPMWVWLCGALSVWGAFGHFKAAGLQKDIAEYKLAQAEANAESVRIARRAEQAKLEASRKVENAALDKATRTAATNSRLNSTVNRLREQLESNTTSNSGGDAATTCSVYAERSELYERLFTESTELVREGAARVGILTDKTTSLQEWINRVCLNDDN